MREEVAPHHAIAALAAGQGGVVARTQLFAIGFSSAAVARSVTTGRLHTVARGVYAVGHPLVGIEGRRWAAVLALGPRRRFVTCSYVNLRRALTGRLSPAHR